jgi:hypothetical protein
VVIPIDVGRQLFVDDFLIERTTLTRTFHHPKPHPKSPVLRPEQPWEKEGPAPMAMPFSDGVWFDPADKRFKMFYQGGYGKSVCLATSADGVEWARPDWGVRAGTNVVHPGPRDSAIVWLDHEEADPRRRFKMFRSHRVPGKFGKNVSNFGLTVQFSPDGVHWEEPGFRTGATGDRTTVFYSPFRKVWVYSIRHGWGFPRRRRYWETPDLINGPQWGEVETAHWWAAADKLDLPYADPAYNVTPELYNLDCVAYESLLLGLFTIWKGDPKTVKDRPKRNQLFTGFSRDGFHWHRPDREPFIPVSETKGDWNWGNVQSAGGCCCVVGDELYFYHSGRAGIPDGAKGSKDGNGSTGLTVLRRDGFASMNAGGDGGELTTRPVRFAGKQLFVNVDGAEGELAAEVLDEAGKVVAGLSKEDCVVVRANSTKAAVTWKNGAIAGVAGRPVRLRFHVKNARLYAFWVARDESGKSGGYLAAGGPGFAGVRDG